MKINVRDVYQGITSLVFPEICLICNQVFEKVCSSCEYRWLQNASSFQLDDLTISAVVTYDSDSSGVVLKAKEDRNKVARSLMANALANSIMSWKVRTDNANLLLVPIPSSKMAIRRRGESFLQPILKSALQICRTRGVKDLAWQSILVHQKRVKDQSELSFNERHKNLENAFKLNGNSRPGNSLATAKIILIDDVVTTGATLLSAARALRERNMTVLGAATVCASAHRLLIR